MYEASCFCLKISVPLIVLFLIFRNKIMEGVASGGTKG